MWRSTISSALIFTVLFSAKAQRIYIHGAENPYGCVCIPVDQCPQDYGINRKFITCGTLESICCVPPNTSSSSTTQIERHSMDEGCGRRRVNISDVESNDGVTKFGEHPWMVAVSKKLDPDRRDRVRIVGICGGSLIHPEAVLTAAHCVSGLAAENSVISAGEWNLRGQQRLPNQYREVREIIIHKDYDESCNCNDIAILILSSPVDLAEHINVVCLPDIRDQTLTPCVATGWGPHPSTTVPARGSSYTLKKVELSLASDEDCENAYRRIKANFFLDESLFCAGGKRGEDTCKGDSGGPLVCRLHEDSTRYVQLGLTSGGVSICGIDGYPGIYTSLKYFLNWIDGNMILNGLDTDIYRYKP